jgi:hypothetical protein
MLRNKQEMMRINVTLFDEALGLCGQRQGLIGPTNRYD